MGPALWLLVACSSSATDPGPGVTGPTGPTGASDDFERSELGPNWVQVQTTSAGIVAGNLGAMTAGAVSIDWAAAAFPADQFSEIVIAAGKDPNFLVQAHVRRQAGLRARYGFHFNPERTPAAWELKYDGVPNAETRILASSTAAGPVPGDVLRLEARGRVLSGYKNGQLVLTATDNAPSAILSAGGIGITARIMVGATIARYPAPIAASWKGGPLP